MLRPSGGSPSAAQTGLGYVRIEEGKEPGKSYEVRKESLSIGRSRESDIFLEDLAVSRLHATIREMSDGSYEIEDHRSAAGTYVNSMRITRYRLIDGDILQIGLNKLTFRRSRG